jgi:zinc protease
MHLMTSAIPSPKTITRIELPNGIIILAYENFSSPAVVISGYLWAGSVSESYEQAGLSNFAAGMLMRGTQTRTFAEINQALESVGAQLGFHGGVHTTNFGGKALAEDLDLLLDMLSDSLQHPTFPLREAEKLRGQILTGLQRRAHDTRRMARLAFDALLYPGHPYGRSVEGYEQTVAALSREDMEGFYQQHYSPQHMVITVVGAVPAGTVVDKVRAYLGAWQAPGVTPDRSVPASVHLVGLRREFVQVAGKTQSDVILGWPALARNDPDFMRASVANTLLGVFGMMGRLGDSVRDQQGLAYYVYSHIEAGWGAGPWVASAGVNPANVEKAIAGILSEIRRLRDEPVSSEELADCQSFMTGTMPLQLETNEGLAATILGMERYGLGLDYMERYAGLVNAVTVQDVRDVAHKYLDAEVYALAIAGPETE